MRRFWREFRLDLGDLRWSGSTPVAGRCGARRRPDTRARGRRDSIIAREDPQWAGRPRQILYRPERCARGCRVAVIACVREVAEAKVRGESFEERGAGRLPGVSGHSTVRFAGAGRPCLEAPRGRSRGRGVPEDGRGGRLRQRGERDPGTGGRGTVTTITATGAGAHVWCSTWAPTPPAGSVEVEIPRSDSCHVRLGYSGLLAAS